MKTALRHDLINYHSLTYCTQDSCSRRAECLRYQAYLNAPPFEVGSFINPKQDPEACRHFRPCTVVRLARGFRGIMHEFKAGDKHAFHDDVQALFSCCPRGVYKYINGKKSIKPDEQSELADICRSYGVELRFDSYEEAYLL